MCLSFFVHALVHLYRKNIGGETRFFKLSLVHKIDLNKITTMKNLR